MNTLINAVSAISGWLTIAAIISSVLVSIGVVVHTLYALRARRRLAYEIRRSARVNASVREELEHLSSHPGLSADERVRLRKLIERHTVNLSINDKKVIEEGLHQRNNRDAGRFADKLVAEARHAA
jgi:DNA-binding transcriptional regulator YbjK